MPTTKVLADYNAIATAQSALVTGTITFTGTVPVMTPNSEVPVEWTVTSGANSYPFMASYTEGANAAAVVKLVANAYGVEGAVAAFQAELTAAAAAMAAATTASSKLAVGWKAIIALTQLAHMSHPRND